MTLGSVKTLEQKDNAIGQRADGFARRYLEGVAQAIVGIVLIGFLFPLLDLGVVAPAALIFALLAVFIILRFGFRFVLLLLLALFVGTAVSIVSLVRSDGVKYVVPVESVSDSLLARKGFGPRGIYYVVPTYSMNPVKRWLLQGVAKLDDSFVFLDSSPYRDGHIAHSPSELAAAAITRKRPNTLGNISFPMRAEEIGIFATTNTDGTGEFRMNYGVRTFGPPLLTDIGPSSPGLFGVASPNALTLDDWQSLGYSEELIRALPTKSVPEIFESLKVESARTGSPTDFLRELALRLALMDRRYADMSRGTGAIEGYELAVIGNLRLVAEAFNARAPDKRLYGNPWLRQLMPNLLATVSELPIRTLIYPEDGNSRELKWLVDTLTKLNGLYVENSLVSELDEAADTDKAEDEVFSKAIEAAARKRDDPTAFFSALTQWAQSQNRQKPVPTGEEARLAQLIERADPATPDEVVAWVRAGHSDRAWRVSRLIDFADSENMMNNLLGGIGKMLSDPSTLSSPAGEKRARAEIGNLTSEWVNSWKFYRDVMSRSIPLIDDPDQRRLIQSEYDLGEAIVGGMVERMEPLVQCIHDPGKAGCEQSDMSDLDSMRFFTAMLPGDGGERFERLMIAVQKSRVAVETLPQSNLGAAFSLDEAYYLALLMNNMLADDITSPVAQVLCAEATARTNWILQEGQLAERASVGAMLLEALMRCQSPLAVTLKRAFRERQLPLPSWHGQIAARVQWVQA